MTKDNKDYIHHYLNQQVQVRTKYDRNRPYLIGRICEVTSGSNHGDWVRVRFDTCHTVTRYNFNELTSDSHTFFLSEDEVKPILRCLSSMTEEECRGLFDCGFSSNMCKEKIHQISKSLFGLYTVISHYGDFDTIHKLLKMGFDLFGLIDAGIAIDKDTLPTSDK